MLSKHSQKSGMFKTFFIKLKHLLNVIYVNFFDGPENKSPRETIPKIFCFAFNEKPTRTAPLIQQINT